MTTIIRASTRDRFYDWCRDELRPGQLTASLNAALVLYLIEMIATLSIAALIFAGEMASQLPYALDTILIGGALLVTVTTLFSSYGGSIASVQDATGVILALAAATIAASVAADAPEGTLFATLMALFVVCTLAMGLTFLLLGLFRLGGLVRFLPYPVMGGFLAGTGWLLLLGGIGVSSNNAAGMDLLNSSALVHWLPAFVLGLGYVLVQKRWNSPLVLAGLLLGALAAFYGTMLALHIPLTELAGGGWLLGPFQQDASWRPPLTFGTLALVDWNALGRAIPVAAPMLLLGVIGMLLNAGGMELLVKRDVSLNRELVVTGAANLVAGAVGGLIGYTAISLSALSNTLGRGKRLPGLLLAFMLALTASAGMALLSWIPRPLLGSLLIYIGLDLLHEWVVRAWRTFPRIDYAVIVSILVMIILKNFLWGIGFGLILTVVLFVLSYSRIDIVRHELSGATFRSRANRSLRDEQLLQAHGAQLSIFKLQGFIFFGTAYNLVERVRKHVQTASPEAVRFVMLDFEHVSGMDSTGMLSFSKLLQFARVHELELILTGLSNSLTAQVRYAGFTEATPGVRLFADMDRGIEWCEEQLLAGTSNELVPHDNLRVQLLALLPDEQAIAALIEHLQRREVAAGERIIRQGDEPDEVFFVAAGQVTAQLEKPGRDPVRLETMQGGRMVGELGFFLGTRRNASVVADQDGVVYFLTRAEWERISVERPDVVQTLDSLAIRLLGQRVAHLTRVVDALH